MALVKDKSKEHWQSVNSPTYPPWFYSTSNRMSLIVATLQLTESARPVLKGEVPLELAMPRISSINKIVHTSHKNTVANYDKDLFARLRFLRKQLAIRKIFHLILSLMMQHCRKWHSICQQVILKCYKLMESGRSN